LGDLGVEGGCNIITYLKKMRECELNSCGSGQGQVTGSYEHGNNIWDSIKGGESSE